MALTKSEKKRLNEIYRDFALTRDHVIIDGEFRIINRVGISIIKRMIVAEIVYELAYQNQTYATVKGTGFAQNAVTPSVLVGWKVEDFGEAGPLNNTFMFPVAVAKKRCESRVVLELAGLYDEQFRGEDEFDNQPESSKKPGKKGITKDGESAVDATIEAMEGSKPKGNGRRKQIDEQTDG